MSTVGNPALVISPLTENRDLINAIQAITDEPREVVIQRLIDEQGCLGINVRRDADAAGLRRYVWSDGLVDFYRTTKSFVYESAVWNRSPLKKEIREWIGGFVRRQNLKGCRVLTFGDGLGFDAAYMAMRGCEVTYFEPSCECSRFAQSVFDQAGLTIQHLTSPDEVPESRFDIVICLDVLEHVPNPPELAASFARWLREGGYLITHSPFFYIEPYHPTHLASNRRYSGDHSFFRSLGLYPFDARFFWDPIVLQKSKTPLPSRLSIMSRLGGAVLRLGRWTWMAHSAVARMMSRGEPHWRDDLVKIQAEESGVKA